MPRFTECHKKLIIDIASSLQVKGGQTMYKYAYETISCNKDIILTEQTASTYYDHFQPPTDEEGEVIVVEGY